MHILRLRQDSRSFFFLSWFSCFSTLSPTFKYKNAWNVGTHFTTNTSGPCLGSGTGSKRQINYGSTKLTTSDYERLNEWQKVVTKSKWLKAMRNSTESEQNKEQWSMATNSNGENVENGNNGEKLCQKEEIPTHHNDAWTCTWPIYMEDWTQRSK